MRFSKKPQIDKAKISQSRVAANEETAVLTPVPDGTSAIDRIPVSRQKLWIIVTSALGVIILGLAAFAIYLADVSHKWEQQVTDVTAQNYDLGERLAAEKEQVVELQGQLNLTAEQLATVQSRMLELADDVNSRDDSVESYARELGDLQATLSTALGVSTSLSRCLNAQQELIGYLKNSANYTPADIAAFENGVNDLCDTATEAHVALQEVLAQ